MDMLNGEPRRQLFPAERPIRTRAHEEVSTYYGENAGSKNSLVADNCIIEGAWKTASCSRRTHRARREAHQLHRYEGRR